MSKENIIEFNNVYLKSGRGSQIFSDFSFSLKAGRSAVITGGPGSGKTSLVELILGSSRVDSGSIEAFGRLIKPRYGRVIRQTRVKIGGVGGIYSLIPSYTVAENISYPLMLSGERTKTVKERLLKMLTEFSLLKQAGEYPSSLTRVENTLVQFARASIANQPLMIIDEPMAGLDQTTFDWISEFLVKVSLSGRSMIILTSEKWSRSLPNTDTYNIENGELV